MNAARTIVSLCLRACLFGLFALGALLPGLAATPTPASTASPAPPTPSATAAPAPEAFPLAEIAPTAQSVLSTLKGLEPEGDADQGAAALWVALGELNNRIYQLGDETSRAGVSAAGSLDTLRELQTNWQKVQAALIDRSKELGERGQALEKEASEVKAMSGRWQATGKTIHQPDAGIPPETRSLVDSVVEAVRGADARIKKRQKDNLDLQNTLRVLLDRADAGLADVERALSDAVKTLLVRDQPPLWDAQAQVRPDPAGRWLASVSAQAADVRAYAAVRGGLFALHGGIFLALLALLLWMRRGLHQLTEEDPHLKRAAPIFEVPVATALALSFLVKGPIYADAPVIFRSLLGAIVLVPTVVILRRLLDRHLSLVLYSLIAFYALDQVRLSTGALPAITRWIFCGEMAAAAGVFLALLRVQRRADAAQRVSLGRWMPVLCVVAAVVFAGALGAAVLGYVRLANLLGAAALFSSYLAVFLYALLRVIEGLTFIALRVRPINRFRIARLHREQVQSVVYRVCRGAAVVFWLYLTLGSLQLRAPLLDRARDVLAYKMTLGSIHLSLDQILGFAAAIWFSVLVSRLIRFFLDEEVYERVQLSPGLPYAISTMLNYAVLLVGFLIALGLLGVDLTKITIVAGAFSVGLGFGLQNIINNFVSGVILLFERPVKVGDVVQLGDAIGEVRRIGIRASIIRTRDGSDLIVPNGNLISNQVTNWTYADRSRAVEIPFNVSGEADPAHVLATLQAAAAQPPDAANRPAPQVYITGITAAGLSVVVRAWTTHYEDWVQVRSDLSAALVTALAREKIKLV